MRIDPTSNALEALVEDLSHDAAGEPPLKDAAETLFKNLFFTPDRYDLSDVGRMNLIAVLAAKKLRVLVC